MANPSNLEGHQTRLKKLQATLPPEKVAKAYVGGGTEYDEQNIGWIEEEAIRRHVALNMASVVDIGCGIGRLTRLLLDCNLKAYLGIDILDPILYEAKKVAKDHAHFTFANVRNFKIPRLDGSVDVVCGFSLITHLLDEQAYLYFAETARVLKPGGLALFSFVDFNHPRH